MIVIVHRFVEYKDWDVLMTHFRDAILLFMKMDFLAIKKIEDINIFNSYNIVPL